MDIFRQLFDSESHTYTYLLADSLSRQAVLIDPVLELLDRDLTLIQQLDLVLSYVLETHAHADHVTSAGELRSRTNAVTVASSASGVSCADQKVVDQQTLHVGNINILVLSTPGHTNGCVSYYVGNRVFTGDALCIRSAGRTDFQGGSPSVLYHSIREKLYRLPDETLVYPAHDYQGMTVSTIGEEKRFNRRINATTTESEFVNLMNSLNLPEPKKIMTALPANLNCGKVG